MNSKSPESPKLLTEVPHENYSATGEMAWFIGRTNNDRVLAMLYDSPYADDPDVWVIVPEFKTK